MRLTFRTALGSFRTLTVYLGIAVAIFASADLSFARTGVPSPSMLPCDLPYYGFVEIPPSLQPFPAKLDAQDCIGEDGEVF